MVLLRWIHDTWRSPDSTGYLIASGLASAAPAYTALLVWLWRSRCEEDGCWRIARRESRGKHVCGRHYRLSLPAPAIAFIEQIKARNGVTPDVRAPSGVLARLRVSAAYLLRRSR